MRNLIKLYLVLCLGLSSAYSHAKDLEAVVLLEKMGVAAKKLDYDGVFTYQTGTKLQAIRIIHKTNSKGEVERLLSLNGAARELVRTNDIVTCIFPEGKQVNVDRRPLGRGFPSDLLSRLGSATPYYEITLGEEARVADRKAKKLLVTPSDNYRYGYHLWVDQETDLLLQSNLLADGGVVLESFAFSSIKLGVEIPDSLLQPHIRGEELTWTRNKTEPVNNLKNKEDALKQGLVWEVDWLPDGFMLVA